ncbi:MAG: ABC transporter permease [Anaerolineae bacterium]
MRKLIVLALKEVRVTFRDVGALIAMLVTPLALTLAMAAAFGTGGNDPLSDIPVLLLNRDGDFMSEELVNVLTSEEMADLLEVETVTDGAEAAARDRVEAGEVAVLIIIPSDFTARSFPMLDAAQNRLGIDLTTLDPEDRDALSPEEQMALAQIFAEITSQETEPATVEIYGSPNWQISTSVVKGIVTQVLEQMNMTTQGINNIMGRLFAGGASTGGTDMGEVMSGAAGEEMVAFGEGSEGELPVRLKISSPSGRGFNWLDYMATSMAILFLMFAVTSGGRTLLAEREAGTLPRLLITPSSPLTVLVGKMGGIVLTGLLQVFVLWGATTLIGARWGSPEAVVVAIVALVICATGVGAVISAWAQTPGQAGAIGTATTLVAAALSGSFFPRMNLPDWVQAVSLITPNAWGIEIFNKLQSGKGIPGILPELGGVMLLTVVYYAIAMVGFRRQFD